jgi:hypothetical protein
LIIQKAHYIINFGDLLKRLRTCHDGDSGKAILLKLFRNQPIQARVILNDENGLIDLCAAIGYGVIIHLSS